MIQYQATVNKDFSSSTQEPEEPIIGYQPRFRPKTQETTQSAETPEDTQVETPTETQENTPQVETVSQEKPQGAEIDFSNTTNLGMRHAASKYLQQKLGLTKEQAAGLVGVWQAESGFNINAENKEEKAGKNSSVKSNQYGIGIGQWTGSRHDDFARYVAEHGGVADLKTQLDFAIDEIQNKYSDYLNNLRKAQTAKDATAYTYAQYTGANERNISSLDDLYARVSKIEAKYAKKHKEMYGKSGSGNLDRRVRAAEESIFAKKGTKLPKFQWGKLLPADTRGEHIDANEIGMRQAFMENNFSSTGKSPKGAKGLFQIMPAALADYLQANPKIKIDLDNPEDNQKVRDWRIGRDIASDVFTKGNPSDRVLWAKTLAAYNYGRRNTINALNKAKRAGKDIYQSLDWLEHLPKETRDYVNFILERKDINKHKNNENYNKAKEGVALSFEDPLPKKALVADPTFLYIQNELNKQINPDH